MPSDRATEPATGGQSRGAALIRGQGHYNQCVYCIIVRYIQRSGVPEGRHPGGDGALQDNIQSCEKIIQN